MKMPTVRLEVKTRRPRFELDQNELLKEFGGKVRLRRAALGIDIEELPTLAIPDALTLVLFISHALLSALWSVIAHLLSYLREEQVRVYLFDIAQDFAVGTSSGLFSTWLWIKIMQRKDASATLNGQPVQNRETIEKILRTILERKPGLESRYSFTSMSPV